MKVVFLDRDGVINEYPGDTKYVTQWKEFKFIPGSIEALRKFNEYGFNIYIVSNQAGVGKGVYPQGNLAEITKRMQGVFKKKRVRVDGIYYCTHAPQDNCLCRKPHTGLLEQALSHLEHPPQRSFVVGDSLSDIETAKNFGALSVLVLSGRQKVSSLNSLKIRPDFVFDNLLLASHYICSHYGE
jgi:histidinol-phosphate phosphatase family protein